MVDTRFEELDFDQHKLVIQAFEFAEEGVDESECVIVRLLLHVETDESGFEVLSEERAAL